MDSLEENHLIDDCKILLVHVSNVHTLFKTFKHLRLNGRPCLVSFKNEKLNYVHSA